LHHIGIIVNSIDDAVHQYSLFHPQATCSEKYYVKSQGVTVLFFHAAADIVFEFIEETDPTSSISTFKKRGYHFYHLGYKTSNYEQSLVALEEAGYKIFDEIISEAYQNKRVRFVLSPESHWLEIIEE
jgi:hypothetical protein